MTQTVEHHPHPHLADDAAGQSGFPPPPGPPPAFYPSRPPGRFAGFMLRLWARSPRWVAPVAILVCLGGAVAYVLGREPIDGAADETTCLLKYTTGYDCPGCGGTRAFFFLIQGNLPAAARHHLVFVFAVPFLVYLYVAWAGNLVFGWRLPQLRPSPLVVGILVATLGVFTVLRNLPWAPFTWFYV
ncbi:MAG: DUF2752 domain-containing protein [Micromonosporaceae bacterium]|nr:DUF2752 domain-containing protein [Micromonosporaceae bacterium]